MQIKRRKESEKKWKFLLFPSSHQNQNGINSIKKKHTQKESHIKQAERNAVIVIIIIILIKKDEKTRREL